MFHHPALSVSVARNGHILVMQGYNRPAFLILRDKVPQFLTSGAPNGAYWIPPFSSSALSCYAIDSAIESIRLSRSLGFPGPPAILFQLRSRLIAFMAQSTSAFDPRTLYEGGVSVVITPKSMASVQCIGGTPSISMLAAISAPEEHAEQGSYYFPAETIRDAIADAISRTTNLIYEN